MNSISSAQAVTNLKQLDIQVVWEIYRKPHSLKFGVTKDTSTQRCGFIVKDEKHTLFQTGNCFVSEDELLQAKRTLLLEVLRRIENEFRDPYSTTSRIFNHNGRANDYLGYLNPHLIDKMSTGRVVTI